MNGLETCQVESDSEYLDIKSEDMMVEINGALAAFNEANHEFQSAKEVSKVKLSESKDKLGAASEEVQALFRTLQDVCNGPRTNFASTNVCLTGRKTGRNACRSGER
jgi:hypothetical protein